MGNWELAIRALAVYSGRRLAGFMSEQRNVGLNRWLVRHREATGARALFSRDSAMGLIRHLRRGDAILLLADQDSTRGRGIFVNFFGRAAYTPAGPAHLSRRTGAAMLPVIITPSTCGSGMHSLRFGHVIAPNLLVDEEEDICRITQEYTYFFEGCIRENPSQWAWVHNRWKHRPGQKIRVRSAGDKFKQVYVNKDDNNI